MPPSPAGYPRGMTNQPIETMDGPPTLVGERVLIATDGSDASQHAAAHAVAVLPQDAEFSLVTIIDPREDPMADAGGFEGPVMDDEEATDRHRESVVDAEGALAATARALGPAPIPQRVIEHHGEGVGARLCELAEEENAAVVVVGSTGRRAIVDAILGSVSGYVLHHAPCPVLVVRHDAA
jgi:nucleotide-binding universal stress UspA family protein